MKIERWILEQNQDGSVTIRAEIDKLTAEEIAKRLMMAINPKIDTPIVLTLVLASQSPKSN